MEFARGLRSGEVVNGPDRVAHRALLHALGLTREDFGKPFIAIANCWNEVVPGSMHLQTVAKAVKEGVASAGGVPLEFNTIAVCDGYAQGHAGMKYALPSRDIIAASVEIMLQAHCFDGVVLIPSCDKVTPGMLMAAARVDIPSIVVSGGPMAAGEHRGQRLALPSVREYAGAYLAGEIDEFEMVDVEENSCPGPGACAMMGTANTMACLTEALGMSLPLSGTTPANSSAKLREAKRAGRRIVEMVRERLKPSALMTAAAFRNAITVTMGIGGSTNSVLHLPAIAGELGLELSLEEFDRLGRRTPYVASITPSSPRPIEDLHRAGGIPAVLRCLNSLLEKDALTVSGRTIGEIAAAAEWRDRGVIRPMEEPFAPEGGIAILYGNLAPGGAVVKKSAVRREMWVHRGPAKVYDSMEAAVAGVKEGQVAPGSVVVIRYEGPVGGPGMREMQMITAIMVGSKLAETTALVTDGRFSGSTRGPCIGHVVPEAAAGGPLAAVRDGDIISIDIPNRRLEIELAAEEIARRLGDWRPPTPPPPGILRTYARGAAPVSEGASLR